MLTRKITFLGEAGAAAGLGIKSKFGDVGLTQVIAFWAYCLFTSSKLNVIFFYKNEMQIWLIQDQNIVKIAFK